MKRTFPKAGRTAATAGMSRGGDVVLEADASVSSLIDYRYKHHFKATRGTHGKGSRAQRGEDLVLKVPVGTVVREYFEDTKETGDIIADLTHDGERVTVANGGVGGRGNIHFVTSTRRAPAFAELGEPAQDGWVELEMKLMADAALVGVPSAGKSSLIARMSAAHPDRGFLAATLVPNLGVVKGDEYNFVVAAVPGLIEGAGRGSGLGHEFLRHIERTALILHVVDMSGQRRSRSRGGLPHHRSASWPFTPSSCRPASWWPNNTIIPGWRDNIRRLEEEVRKDAVLRQAATSSQTAWRKLRASSRSAR